MTSRSAFHAQVHVPTGVTHAVPGFFTHPAPSSAHAEKAGLPNLVVVRSTVLELYAPHRGLGTSLKLELLSRQALFGVVESVAVLKGRSSCRDALALAFRDAKVSVLQWDTVTGDLVPSSLHYFEGDESLKAGRHAFPRPPKILTDPAGRCIAVVMLRHQLAVLPAVESDSAGLGVSTYEEPSLGVANPTSATVGNSYVDNLSKMGIREVRDAVFVYGAAEPTLLVLHEADPTWAGNLRSKRDTCVVTALSLNLTAKRHPRIWGLQDLPYDAYALSAVPSGGCLLLTGTGVLYFSQTQKAGVILNSGALPAAQAPPPFSFNLAREAPGETAARYARAHVTDLHPQAASGTLAFCDTSNAAWNLDCSAAHVAWIGPSTALVGFRSGHMMLLEVVVSAGGSRLRVARAGAAPVASCMASVSESLVFIGSLAGDSLLVSCTDGADKGIDPVEAHDSKRRRIVDKVDLSPDGIAYEDDDASLIYGEYGMNALEVGNGTLQKSLRVVDSLISIGPVRSMASSSGADPYIVACCGGRSTGALAVVRRSVVPDLVTEVPLPGVFGCWAVGGATVEDYHTFLLLSFIGTTKVLATGDALKEVTDAVEFAADTPTIAAGTVSGGRRIVQAFPQGIRLLEGGEIRQELWAADLAGALQDGPNLSSVQICDPWVLVQMSDGHVHALRIDTQDASLKKIAAVPAPHGRFATACCVYADHGGWMPKHLGTNAANYCVVAFSDGSFALWALPDAHVLGAGFQFAASPLWHCAGLVEGSALLTHASDTSPGQESSVASGPVVTEIKLERFMAISNQALGDAKANCCWAPLLVALTSDHCLLAYKAFCSHDGGADAYGLRFKRLDLDAPPLVPPMPSPLVGHHSRMVRFDGMGESISHSGIFVAGATPLWLIASRGFLFSHPHHLPGGAEGVHGFTPFNNVNCPKGFISICGGTRSCLQIAGLPRRQHLDAPWPRQKLALKATPLRVCFYAEAQLFAVATVRMAPSRPFLPEEPGGEPQASYSYALADATDAVRGSAPLHEIRLMAPGSWTTVTRYSVLPGEHVLALEAVHLRDSTTGSTVPMLAVGMGFAAGEDYPCGGRLLLFEVKPTDGGGWTAEMVYAREFKGPVMGLTSLEGHLLLATGNRLETCTLESSTPVMTGVDNDEHTTTAPRTTYKLQRSAFYDGPSLVTSLCVVKSFALVGDATHSVQFVRYREEGRQLGLLGKDFGRGMIRSAQFIISGSTLHIVAADGGGALRTFTYSPADPNSWKGQKLAPWGVLHIGEGIGDMVRLKMPQIDPNDATVRQGVLYGTDSGGLGVVLPLVNITHLSSSGGGDGVTALETLKMLSRNLVTGTLHSAGLNPAAFRRRHARALDGVGVYGASLPLAAQGILDGDLLLRFTMQPRTAQARLAAKAGTTREDVLSLLSVLFRSAWML